MRIVIADDDTLSRQLTQRMLEYAGYEVIAVENGYLAAEHLSRTGGPRLALLDWMMPGLDGPAICRSLRARMDQPYIYLILLTSRESKGDLVAGLSSGADDYLTKPCNGEELKARLRTGQRILRLHDKLLHDSRHDALTTLPNRAHFCERLNSCIRRSESEPGYIFSVLFVDLDRFKTVNDSLGHPAGDDLIAQVGKRLLNSIRGDSSSSAPGGQFGARSGDLVARLGGDEFTVLLDGIRDASDATVIADRIHTEIAQPFAIAGREYHISASVGVSVSAAGYSKPGDMLHDADAAMYSAKVSGRVMVSRPTGTGRNESPLAVAATNLQSRKPS